MTEKEKAKLGMLYDANYDEELIRESIVCRDLCHEYNQLKPSMFEEREALIRRILKQAGENLVIHSPFKCDYGYNIYLGKEVMLNYGCVLLDVCPISIGDHTLIGPYTQIYTACHSLDPLKRKQSIEYGKPVVIGQNVWIGGGCIILPGVTIGDNSVIGAGSVVTKDIEANVIAVGNPCKVIKKNEDNSIRSYE